MAQSLYSRSVRTFSSVAQTEAPASSAPEPIDPTPQAAGMFVELTGANDPLANPPLPTFQNAPAAAFVDVDGDGDRDLLIGDNAGTVRYFQKTNANYVERTGADNPFGTFVTGNGFSHPAAIDIDGDGDKDLVIGANGGTLFAYRNNGGGSWTQLTGSANPFASFNLGSASKPTGADVDGDGRDDLVVGNLSGLLTVFRHNADHSFTQRVGADDPFNGADRGDFSSPAAADLDGDRDIDLLVGYADGILRIFYNVAGTFVASGDMGDYGSFVNPALADLDGDSDADLVVGDDSGGDTRVFQHQLVPNFTGTAGNDALFGTPGADFFDLRQGGFDFMSGEDGNDGFYFGAAYTFSDTVQGGPGNFDQVALQGNYSAQTGLASMADVEFLVLLPGNDTRFGGETGTNLSYNLQASNATVAAGTRLIVSANTLRSFENLTFNGANETDGFYLIYGGLGTDVLTGGSGSDGFFFGQGRFGPNDIVNGGPGTSDQIGFQGDFGAANRISFGASQLSGVEFIVCLSAADGRFGSAGGTARYNFTMNDGNVAAGQTMTISANTLRAFENLDFFGEAESNGAFRIFSGAGNDLIRGGAGADIIFGGAGRDFITGNAGIDQLTGGAGEDSFIYFRQTDSLPGAADRILDFSAGDKIDLVVLGAVSGFSDGFRFSAPGGSGAGRVEVNQTGSQATVIAFIDGDQFADFVIDVTVADGHTLTASDFLLSLLFQEDIVKSEAEAAGNGCGSGSLWHGDAHTAEMLLGVMPDHTNHDFDAMGMRHFVL